MYKIGIAPPTSPNKRRWTDTPRRMKTARIGIEQEAWSLSITFADAKGAKGGHDACHVAVHFAATTPVNVFSYALSWARILIR